MQKEASILYNRYLAESTPSAAPETPPLSPLLPSLPRLDRDALITLAAAFVIGPCAVENAPCAETTAPVVMIWGAVIAFLSAADALRLSKRRSE